MQGEILLFKWNVLRENGLSHPAKGGSTPAFACQRAAIAPLPCLNLQLIPHSSTLLEFESFKKCDCSRKTILQIFDLLRKCGLLAHTSAAFLKNCCTEKLFSCLRLESYNHHLKTPCRKSLPDKVFSHHSSVRKSTFRTASRTFKTKVGETESSSIPIRKNRSVKDVSAASSPQMPIHAPCS